MPKEHHAFDWVGPGGRNCPCCGPAPKYRKKHDRTIKRRIKQAVRKAIEREQTEE